MKTLLERFAREPNAIVGVLVTAYGLLVAFGVLTLNPEQIGAVTAFGGAVVVLIRWVVVPWQDVEAYSRPWESKVRAGPAAEVPTDEPVVVRPLESPLDSSPPAH